MTVEERIARLESEVASLRRRAWLAAGVATACVALALGACQQAGQGGGKALKTFRIANEDGSRELVLTPEGWTLSADGHVRADVQAGDAATTLTLRDATGRRRISALATGGPAGLSILSPEEKDAAVLAAGELDPVARVELFAGSRDPRAGFAVAKDGKGSLTVVSSPGRPSAPEPAPSPK